MRRALSFSLSLVLAALPGCKDDGSATSNGDGGPVGPRSGTDSDAGPTDPSTATLRAVSPNHISTLGGEVLTISGSGFVEPMTVTLGGEPVEVTSVRDDEVVVTAPRLPPGRATLVVALPEQRPAVLTDAVLVEPRTPRFVSAPPEWAEAPDAVEVRDAVAFDVEADGDMDVVVATEDGLRVLLNDGRGQLALQSTVGEATGDRVPARPGGASDVRALHLADLDGDGKVELLACTDAGRELHFDGKLTGLTDRTDLPYHAGGCRALASLHVPGVERAALAIAVDAPSEDLTAALFLLVPDAAGGFEPLDSVAAPPTSPVVVGPADSADPGVAQAFVQTLEGAQAGGGAARLTYSLTDVGPDAVFHLGVALAAMPDRLRFFAQHTMGAAVTLRPRFTDSAGVVFEGPETPVDAAAWTAFDLADVSTWPAQGAAPDMPTAPTPPLTELSFVVHAAGDLPLAGELRLDTIVTERTGEMPRLLHDFEYRTYTYRFPTVARMLTGDLDSDGRDDLLVLPGGAAESAPQLLRTAAMPAPNPDVPPFLAELVPVTGPGPFTHGALLDVDHDGSLDAVLTSGAQDRLLVGDGWGRLLDATFGLLPVDWADGQSLAVADVNGDTLDDLLIGNRGKTDRLYLGRGDGRFLDATPDLGLEAGDTAALVVVDLDGDGDLDVVSLARDGQAAPHVRIAQAAFKNVEGLDSRDGQAAPHVRIAQVSDAR